MLARQAVRTCGIDGLALTKLDILDGFEEINVAIAYRLDGKEIDYLPASQSAQARVEPLYETVKGWRCRDQQSAIVGGSSCAGDKIRSED